MKTKLDTFDIQHLLNRTNNLVCVINLEGTILETNISFLNIFRLENEETNTIQLQSLLMTPDRIRLKKVLKNLPMNHESDLRTQISNEGSQPLSIEWSFFYNQNTKQVLCLGEVIDELREKEIELNKAIDEVQYVKDALDQYAIVATTDRKGKITYANQKFCEISKYTLDELIGKDHRLLNSNHHPKEFMVKLWNTLNSGKVWKGHIKNKSKDGTYYWVDTTIVPFLDKEGKPIRFTAIRFEITDQKKLVEELEEAKVIAERNARAKDQFLANMSHEIRTPMNAIIGFTEVLKSTNLTEEQKEFVDAIATSGENLMVIINDVLDSSKIESNNIRIESIPVNITDLLKQLEKVLGRKADEKQINLNVSTDIDVPEWVISDPVRLNQVLINLANNALKFTEKGSVNIDCSLVQKNGERCILEFKVKDTGIGIPEEKLDTIFERFQQAEDYTTRKYGGTGLGLSIAQELVRLLGGTIKVQSRIDVGTQFRVRIPFDITNDVNASDSNFNKEIVSFDNLRVLLAEDNILNQKLAENVMKNFNIDLTIVNNGAEAVEIVQQKEFDVILMDLQMPILDGHSATRKILNDLRINIPIIAMTAHSLVGEQEACFEAGMSGFLSKPYKASDLIKVLQDQNIGVQEKIHSPDKAFSMDQFSTIIENDPDFLNETVELVINTIPGFIEQIASAEKEQDLHHLKRSMHGMKPTFIMFNHSAIISINRKIEDSTNFDEVRDDLPQLKSLLQEFKVELSMAS